MKLQYFTFLVFVVFGIQVLAQKKIETKMAQILSKPEYKNAAIGICFHNLENGEVILNINSEKLMIPASVLKIVTTASALELLGDKYRFKTQIGYSGKISNNVLNGDLILVGGGDPTLGSEYFSSSELNDNFLDTWVKQIKAAGIKKINGKLILDGSIYDSEKIPPTWIWEDIGNYYGAGANAFTVYDNLFRITFKSANRAGELTEIISLNPKIIGLEIQNEVLSSDINKDQAYVFGSPLDKKRIIRGAIPKERDAFTIKASIHQPGEILARDLFNRLAIAGVFISGDIVFRNTEKSELNTIYTHFSPELNEIVKVINHKSVNLFAEHLVMQIAYEKTGIGNRKTGIEIINEFWESKGLNKNSFFMEDGSGLSHFNAISPANINFILTYMFKQSENRKSFLSSLPGAGDGTLTSFSSKAFSNGTLKAKSGSMTRVRSYSGYLNTDYGKELAFTIMFNNFPGSNSELTVEIKDLLYYFKKYE